MQKMTAGQYADSYQPGADTRTVRFTIQMRTIEGVPTKILINAPYAFLTIDGVRYTLHEATLVEVS